MTAKPSRCAGGPAAGAAASRPQRDGKLSVLAWCGWRLLIPEDWRPLRLEGGWRAGSMMIGDATQAIAKVSWAHIRPRGDVLDATDRAGVPLRPAGARRRGRGAVSRALAAAAGFTQCRRTDWSRTGRAAWWGYAARCGLLLEIVFRTGADSHRRGELEQAVLPSIAADVPDGDGWTRWAIHGAAFLVPPGFVLAGQSLHLGEISLRFARRRQRLSVGQVYPAELALSRRPLGFWLTHWPWRRQEFRRLRPDGASQEWVLPGGPGRRVGLVQPGRRTLRWPLGFLAPRRVLSAAAVDESRGRILRAELDCPHRPEEALLRQAVAGMNWSDREGSP